MDTSKFTQTSFLIKLLELLLGAACVGLIAGEYGVAISYTKTEVVYATYFGFFMVTCVVVCSYVLDSPIKGVLMMVISLCAGVFYFTSGALNIEFYRKIDNGKILGAGILGFANGLLFIVDCFLAWRLK